MYLVMRDVGDGEILIGVVSEEKQLTDRIVKDIMKRFPPGEEDLHDRQAFLEEAYRKYVLQYKLVSAG